MCWEHQREWVSAKSSNMRMVDRVYARIVVEGEKLAEAVINVENEQTSMI